MLGQFAQSKHPFATSVFARPTERFERSFARQPDDGFKRSRQQINSRIGSGLPPDSGDFYCSAAGGVRIFPICGTWFVAVSKATKLSALYTAMPRETAVARAARIRKILAGLQAAHPNAHCELNFRSPLQLLIATILSAQCTDKRVNLVTADLFVKYRNANDFANADLAELEQAIKTTGFFRNKARNIQACCRALVAKYGGEVPRSMAELTALDGAGRKTANVVLGNAFAINDGIVVDTHVTRLANRLGLTKQSDAVKIEQDLMVLVPRAQWALFSHWLIWHGRRRCGARNPDCMRCEIAKLCPRVGLPQKPLGEGSNASEKYPPHALHE